MTLLTFVAELGLQVKQKWLLQVDFFGLEFIDVETASVQAVRQTGETVKYLEKSQRFELIFEKGQEQKTLKPKRQSGKSLPGLKLPALRIDGRFAPKCSFVKPEEYTPKQK